MIEGQRYVDPKVTARFLETRASVLAAQAWLEGQSLLARVIVDSFAEICESDLLESCIREIGATHTPERILIERSVSPAA